MNKTKPFKDLKLNKEEKMIEKALEKDAFVSVSDLRNSRKLFQEAAKNYRILRRTKKITIRVNQVDLIKVKVKAKKRGIPYQTLLNVLIRQYAGGLTQVEL